MNVAHVAACDHCGLPVRRLWRQPHAEVTEQPRYCCLGCRLASGLSQPQGKHGEQGGPSGTLLLRLGFGIFLAMNLMAFSWLGYSREILGAASASYDPLTGLFAYLQMLLATCVVALLGLPLVAAALEQTSRWRRLDANALILVAVAAAFAVSVLHTVRGSGSLYFDTAAGLLVLVTLGRFLEASAKRRATSATEALRASLPRRAWIRSRGTELAEGQLSAGLPTGGRTEVTEIRVEDIRVGDQVRVRPGESVPIDGKLLEGASHVDESKLTGEALARPVSPGDRVLAGSANLDGQIWLCAERLASESTLAQMEDLLERAGASLPPIQRIADRIAAWFGIAVVALAASLFVWHALRGEAMAGLFVSLSVLLISCPCALGVAAPLASWSALRRAAAAGILFDSATSLERAARVSRVLFDKTGTLTDIEPELTSIATTPGTVPDEALAMAASLELGANHPIAEALVRAAETRGLLLESPSELEILPGVGVVGRIADGRRLRLGNRRLFLELLPSAVDPEGPEEEGPEEEGQEEEGLRLFLMRDAELLATFELDEKLRPDAASAITQLARLGLSSTILTGDRRTRAQAIGKELGVTAEGELLPEDKVARLRELRGLGGGLVMMVGDGLNDAPVLAAADLGVAVVSAVEVSQSAAQVRLLTRNLAQIPRLIEISRHALRRIRLSLAWAFGYNAIGITLAAGGLLTPLFAATAMVFSSMAVVVLASGAGRLARAEEVSVRVEREPEMVPEPA